jgi:hypothetical protein
MSKTDGIWSHNYLRDDNDGQCLICHEDITNHSDGKLMKNVFKVIPDIELRKYKSCPVEGGLSYSIEVKRAKTIESVKANELCKIYGFNEGNESLKEIIGEIEGEDIKLKVGKDCTICLSLLTDAYVLKCNHEYCRPCITEYLKAKISVNEIEGVPCPQGVKVCETIIEEAVIKELVSDADFQKFQKFKKTKEIIKAGGVLCPMPNCEGYTNETSVDTQFLVCSSGHPFCRLCLQAAHDGINCDNKLENEFLNWAKQNKQVRKCPRCGFYIQKNEGCNHMTCASCKYQFCWLCMKEYKSNHYSDFLSGCYRLQNSTNVIYNSPLGRILKRIAFILLILLAVVLVIPFPSVLIAVFSHYTYRKFDLRIFSRRKRSCLNATYLFTVIALSIALIPLGYMLLAFAMFLMPVWLLMLIHTYVK